MQENESLPPRLHRQLSFYGDPQAAIVRQQDYNNAQSSLSDWLQRELSANQFFSEVFTAFLAGRHPAASFQQHVDRMKTNPTSLVRELNHYTDYLNNLFVENESASIEERRQAQSLINSTYELLKQVGTMPSHSTIDLPNPDRNPDVTTIRDTITKVSHIIHQYLIGDIQLQYPNRQADARQNSCFR